MQRETVWLVATVEISAYGNWCRMTKGGMGGTWFYNVGGPQFTNIMYPAHHVFQPMLNLWPHDVCPPHCFLCWTPEPVIYDCPFALQKMCLLRFLDETLPLGVFLHLYLLYRQPPLFDPDANSQLSRQLLSTSPNSPHKRYLKSQWGAALWNPDFWTGSHCLVLNTTYLNHSHGIVFPHP